ncbi:transposase [Cucumis melo var. makuwa]|uniref:Transposase n=1 Tax=Cucumis melo var. makuwa TaxID=1194695 RepID=A0A5A7UIK9_CUCMM|nr:transposase [Cucumis melo var. makuwa]
MIEVAHEEYSKDPNGFEKLLIDAEKPLKEFSNATECPECGQSRWKNVKDRNEERKQIPSKVIWYFPPIPRFKRLFRSIECAENLTWHASERIEDGPKQPGDDIGTYLAPLIEDLKLLWENGVECYDAYREEVFNLRSVLLWTIIDFPAYGNLSGCCVKGYKACPICGDNTNSIRLRHGKKIAYLGHRRFLARDHPYRRQKKSFNGKKELEGIEEKGKRIEVESLDKPKHKEKKGKEVMKMNEPELDVLKERDLIKMPTEVVCESTSTLPLALKSILRYAEKVMEKDSSITFSLPADLFGVSRKTSVLREAIVDLCNMNEVKTFTLVAYMMYLYSSVSGSKENMQYVFVDPSLISFGNTQESRIRNLCSRLMVSKPDQVVLAPFNPGGHWALLAINAYEDTVFYLDSLRTTSKATTRYVTDTAIEIFHSQKNINKSRKQTLWRTCPLQVGSTTCGYYVMKYMREIVNRGSIVISDSIDTRKSYSQAELDEVRVELVEFVGSYM